MEQNKENTPNTESFTQTKVSRGADVLEIVYSDEEKNKQTKKAIKKEQLKQNPETLFADFSSTEHGRKLTNLLFHTEYTEAWHTAFCKFYKNITKGGVCKGRQIKVRDEEDNCAVLTLNIYHNGTIMAQGTDEKLEEFKQVFPQIKDQAKVYKDLKSPVKNQEEQIPTDILSRYMPDVPSPTVLRDCLSQLEGDFIQFKEQLQRQLGDKNVNDQLREELNTLKSQHESILEEIRSTMQQLQQENTQLREEITSLKLQMNQEKESKAMVCTDKVPISKQQSGETHQLPKINITKPSNIQDNSNNPETTNKPSSNHKNRQQTPEIVLIIDSNGKYLNTKRLFPGTRVSKIHCSTIEQATGVINDPYFTNPKHIIIHTGTNNIQEQQEVIVDKFLQLTETAQQKFPQSKLILSCLLPRRDISNNITQQINTELADKTRSKPSIHLAQHHSIPPQHLYDNKHLNKQGVSILAREFKDIVLGRSHYPEPDTNHPQTDTTTTPQTPPLTQYNTLKEKKGPQRWQEWRKPPTPRWTPRRLQSREMEEIRILLSTVCDKLM